MSLQTLNACLLIGWLLVTVGALLLNVGAGLIVSGALLLALTLFMARIGGVVAPAKAEGESA